MDAIVCSAVLHFARDREHLERMLHEMWRVLAPGGLFFARLATSIGITGPARDRPVGRVRLPDGSQRFVVDERFLVDARCTARRVAGGTRSRRRTSRTFVA